MVCENGIRLRDVERDRGDADPEFAQLRRSSLGILTVARAENDVNTSMPQLASDFVPYPLFAPVSRAVVAACCCDIDPSIERPFMRGGLYGSA